jgi:hypothetical protein
MGGKYCGPLGGSTNNPLIDEGTMGRQQNRPPVRLDNSDWLSRAANEVGCYYARDALRGVLILQDEYAEEIFIRWLFGFGAPETVFDNDKWASYMRNEEGLRKQIVDKLSADALNTVNRSPMPNEEGDFTLTFHAEVGSKYGGYNTGYNVLHGSNSTVGDFVITGHYRVGPSSSPGGGYTVLYENLSFVFNDIVDVFSKNIADVKLGELASYMAQCYGVHPRDYTLRIKWKALEPVEVEVNGTSAIAKPWSG